MKNKSIFIKNNWAKFTAVALATLGLAGSAYAIPLNTMYSSILASSSAPGQNIAVNWEVSTSLNPGVYTYEYQVVNPLAASVTVDILSVAFDAVSNVTVLAVGGGSSSYVETGDGMVWLLAPVPGGSSTPALNTAGVLYFTSPDLPAYGNASASDSNPPSPWGSTLGGQQVAVPSVPQIVFLKITQVNPTNVVLSWTNSAVGWALQTTPSINPPVTWSNAIPAPIQISGQFIVTNPIAGAHCSFYRLITTN